MEPLTPEEIRVLGSLIEKEITTPEYYPLTLNALVNACNQKSSRDPVVNYDEGTVAHALALLRNRGLAGRVSGAGHRVEKYGHSLGEKLNLGRREIALLCVLMLRGPQTVGELRGRTERMYEFSGLEEAESVLESLASREPEPLAARMPRGRWAQLLGGPIPETPGQPQVATETTAATPRIDLIETLTARVASLEQEIESLKAQFDRFRRQFE